MTVDHCNQWSTVCSSSHISCTVQNAFSLPILQKCWIASSVTEVPCFPREISTVSMTRSTQRKASVISPKRQRKTLGIAQHVRLLDMLKEGKNYAAVGSHYGIKQFSVRYIEKEESMKFWTLRVCRQERNVGNVYICVWEKYGIVWWLVLQSKICIIMVVTIKLTTLH